MSTIKTTNITHGSNSGTANMVLASDGTITFAKPLDNTPIWIVKPTSSGNVDSSTATKVVWGTELLDTDSAFASDKFTVSAGKAGAYFIRVQVCMDDIENQKELMIWVYKNGSAVLRSYGYASTDNQINQIHEHSSVHSLAVADYLEIYVLHGTSGTQGYLADRTRWEGFRLAGYNP